MEEYLPFFFIVFFAMIPVALFIIFKPVVQQKKLLNGVTNYDTFMRKYVYHIDLTKEAFYSQLKIRNINDLLEYSLSDDLSVIIFEKYLNKFPYSIELSESEEGIILKVSQTQLTSRISYDINAFFIGKFNAKPLNYNDNSF